MTELKHYGVKGMKWGVRKARDVVRTQKAKHAERVKKYDANVKAKAEAHYEKNKNKRSYKRMHASNLKELERKHKNNPSKDVKTLAKIQTRREFREIKTRKAIAGALIVSQLVQADILYGENRTGKFVNKMMSPDNIRSGKNIMQAAKRSPVRYVDGKKIKNVVNMAAGVPARR